MDELPNSSKRHSESVIASGGGGWKGDVLRRGGAVIDHFSMPASLRCCFPPPDGISRTNFWPLTIPHFESHK